MAHTNDECAKCLSSLKDRCRWKGTGTAPASIYPDCNALAAEVNEQFRFQHAARNRALAPRANTRAPVNSPWQQFSLPLLATSSTSVWSSIMASMVHRVHATWKRLLMALEWCNHKDGRDGLSALYSAQAAAGWQSVTCPWTRHWVDWYRSDLKG